MIIKLYGPHENSHLLLEQDELHMLEGRVGGDGSTLSEYITETNATHNCQEPEVDEVSTTELHYDSQEIPRTSLRKLLGKSALIILDVTAEIAEWTINKVAGFQDQDTLPPPTKTS